MELLRRGQGKYGLLKAHEAHRDTIDVAVSRRAAIAARAGTTIVRIRPLDLLN
jgi:hypothetical protein